MTFLVLQSILILLAVVVLVVALFRRLNIPPILGYIVAGILVGPMVMGWISSADQIHYVAQFGLVFLLFTIGLEFSVPQLIAMRRSFLGLGGGQVFFTTLVFSSIVYLMGESIESAFVVGSILALSSTAIVTKLLTDQVETNSRHGRCAIGVLLFQDLMVVPLLVIIPILSGETGGSVFGAVSLSLLKAVVVLILMLALGRFVLRPVFYHLVKMRSPELFTLTILLAALGAAFLTHEAGLSYELGAFLAGMTLGETAFRHQIEADIRPFQDVLLGLFFVAVGMMVDFNILQEYWLGVLITTLVLVLTKFFIIALLGWILRLDVVDNLRTALLLAQGGEFGFALLGISSKSGLISPAYEQMVLVAIFISMILSAGFIRFNREIVQRLLRGKHDHGEMEEAMKNIKEPHVIICGYGRVGQNVARFLDQEGFPYVALDLDPVRIKDAQTAGDNVHYGDSTRKPILMSNGLREARMLVVSFDEPRASLKILEVAREIRPDMPVLIRTRDDAYLDALQKAGATEVVPETLEASLMLSSHILLLLGIPVSKIFRNLREVRADRYKLLRGFFHGDEAMALDEPPNMRARLTPINIESKSFAVGKTLAQLELERVGVSISAVRREGIRGFQPEENTLLKEGDILVLYGAPEAIERAEKIILVGL